MFDSALVRVTQTKFWALVNWGDDDVWVYKHKWGVA